MADELIKKLSANGKLPTPPGVVMKILDLTAQSNTSVAEITDVIALDSALSAKILRFVNSPMSGVTREVTALKQAVALMGVRGVKMMALSFSVLASSTENRCAGFDSEHFSIHSVACATACKTLSEVTGIGDPQESFSAGLLCQLGRSIFASSLPDEYARVLSQARHVPADLPSLERAAFGQTYATVGGAVLRLWNLPEPLCTAVNLFREPLNRADLPPLAKLLAVAEMAADLVCPPDAGTSVDPVRYLESVRTLYGLPDEQALSTLSRIAVEVDNVRALMEVPKGTLRTPETIENELRERIAELSLAMHLENRNMAEQQEELLRRATTDALTGVGNRAAFDARLELEVERALRVGAPLTLVLMDVDRFKEFNDTYGHQLGDKVLKTVAGALDDSVRKIDFVARYGGEEFAILAPNTSADHAAQLAERLRCAVAAATISSEKGTLRVTVSVGVAVLVNVNDPAKDACDLIKRADKLLYQAKCNGRNRVECENRSRQAVSA